MPTEITIENSILAVGATYQSVFGRAPNSQESAGWAEQIGNNGATAAQLATVLAKSPEGAARVSALYQQVLGRGSTGISSSEIAAAEAYLGGDTANGLANLRTSMASSAEAQADIKAVYQTVLGRVASSGEVSNAETALADGATLASLYSSAEASPELKANLNAAYTSTFGTAPSAAVVTYLQQQIVGGAGFSQLATALSSLAGGIIAPQITSAAQDPAGAGYVDVSGTGQPGASIAAIVSVQGQSITSPFAATTVNPSGRWSVTNAPGSGGPGAGTKIPNGTYSVTPLEAFEDHVRTGTATSITVGGSGVSIPDTFNPAESMVASGSGSGVALTTATTGASVSGASPIQITNPATIGITPMLHG